MSRIRTAWLLVAACLLTGARSSAQDVREVRIGMSSRIEGVVLPGGELEPKPVDAKSPLILRITHVWPHGTDKRYDFEFYALDPGEYDLAGLLQRKDGTPAGELPAIRVRASTALPAGQIKPHSPQPGDLPSVGGYTKLLWVGGIVWALGLVAILASGRRKRMGEVARRKPLSMAEELRPLLEAARARSLSSSERSQLEMRLVAFWRQRLGLDREDPVRALAQLKHDERAGALLRAVELWLHAPGSQAEIDIESLLAPYREEFRA